MKTWGKRGSVATDMKKGFGTAYSVIEHREIRFLASEHMIHEVNGTNKRHVNPKPSARWRHKLYINRFKWFNVLLKDKAMSKSLKARLSSIMTLPWFEKRSVSMTKATLGCSRGFALLNASKKYVHGAVDEVVISEKQISEPCKQTE